MLISASCVISNNEAVQQINFISSFLLSDSQIRLLRLIVLLYFIGMKEPLYEYEFPAPYVKEELAFPEARNFVK